jgi:hypothetical protein
MNTTRPALHAFPTNSILCSIERSLSSTLRGLLSCALLLSILFASSACSPVYKKFYTYEPMKSDAKRACSINCQSLKQSCSINQQQSYQLCQTNARLEYQTCKANERWGYNKKGEYECRDNCYCFESSCDEPDPELCEEQYATCYRGCGGNVNETIRCVENCEKAS